MKVTVCQLDNRSGALEPMLEELVRHVHAEQSDFLLLPEMCFAEWLAADPHPDAMRWRQAVQEHERYIEQLGRLGARAVMGTRPIVREQGSFRNQAYLWTREAGACGVHEKYYLPDEASYWEQSWYDRGDPCFEICRGLGVRMGVLICTEMWFLEWARVYAIGFKKKFLDLCQITSSYSLS